MLNSHLPLLPILIPLLAAPLCFILGTRKLAWLLATVASGAATCFSFSLLLQTFEGHALSYALGGWQAPWGIELRVDGASAFVLLAVSALSTLVLCYAYRSIEKEVDASQQSLYYSAHMLCLAGLSGILITGDAFNLFVFLEVSSLATYSLVSLASDRRALTSTFRYLIMGTIGATFILIGVGLLYSKTGTLNMLDLAQRINDLSSSRTINAGLAFIMVGASIKLALFPLHMWLPGAYTFAPSAVTSFLAGTATKVAVYVMFRFIFTVFGVEHVFEAMHMDKIFVVLAVISIFKCSFTAVVQSNVKKLLAYSSVAQIGYIILGLSLVSVSGLSASLLHIFNHALMKCALFMAVGAVFYQQGSVHIRAFSGLGKKMPLTMGAFTIAGLSIIGVPLTVGFISKWQLVTAVLDQNNWVLALLVLVGSLFAVIYIGRVLEAAYFKDVAPEFSDNTIKEAPVSMLIPMWILVLANVYFGIDTEFTIGAATHGAEMLFGQTDPSPLVMEGAQ